MDARGGGSTTTRCSARCTRAQQGRAWQEWAAPLRERDAGALAKRAAGAGGPRSSSTPTCSGWRRTSGARRATRADIGIFGDFPFMVSGDSADVWARQQDFRLDASVGAPPDAFSETGQDWGFPAYRWDVIAAGGLPWLAARARRSAELYDGYRVDHLVGFFRTYVREEDGEAAFVPAGRGRADRRRGSACSTCSAPPARGSSPRISASSRRSCARRWRGSRSPATRSAAGSASGTPGQAVQGSARRIRVQSVATSGTHDTETIARVVGRGADRGAPRRCGHRP